MIIQPTQPNNVSFGYKHQLKDLYKSGKLNLKYGIYGGELTRKNVSLEHLKPISRGGKTELKNLALATKENNNKRGNDKIGKYLNIEQLTQYLNQFRNVVIENFEGNKYIAMVLENIRSIL